jgi:2-polyprenyl-6-hydroxyphenyl methylase / 3-demethylubiquinone-9 3-methyltransferase
MRSGSRINNEFYDGLNDLWYEGSDHPIALLRVEARYRNPWVLDGLREAFGDKPAAVLDLGCGAGFLSNELAAAGHAVTGVDRSPASLDMARRRDKTGSARYVEGDLTRLPLGAASFDAVCAMDVLEHIEDLPAALDEVARVLKPGGRFFYYTFNRNPLSWLLAVQGIRWIKNSPPNVHVYRLLIKPSELAALCAARGFETEAQLGFGPVINSAFWRLVRTRQVQEDFRFSFKKSLAVAYMGRARKKG